MVPLMIDPARVTIAVIGEGPLYERRISQLRDGGATQLLTLSADEATSDTLADRQVVYIAGIETEQAKALGDLARNAGALVNVEDVIDACDFYMPAVVRRGDLMLTVSTGGKSPGLARKLRQHLEGEFGEEWAGIVDDVAAARQEWIAEGANMKTVADRTAAMIDENGWLA